jgi:hypothetical protein
MPNWCINKLDVIGTQSELEEFKKAVSDADGNFSFAALVPPPAEESRDADWDWRSWTSTHWGTKWDIAEGECTFGYHEEDDEPTMMWEFPTAWAPPIPWVGQVAEQYPNLTFKLWFDEPGMSFSGCAVFRTGGVDKSESWETDVSFMLGECAVRACDEVVYVDAFSRHTKKRDNNEHYYCDEHALFELVEEAANSGTINN